MFCVLLGPLLGYSSIFNATERPRNCNGDLPNISCYGFLESSMGPRVNYVVTKAT